MSGRIWERTDDDYLIGVEFSPFYTSNTSILEGETSSYLRHLLHGLPTPRTATLELTASILAAVNASGLYVTNVNHWSNLMRSRPDDGYKLSVHCKHSLQSIAAPLSARGYCVNYDVGSPCSRCLCSNDIDIKVSRQHTVSASNFQSIKVSTDDGMVHF